MTGKAYTMREMRGIVEYIIEQRAYKDVKGRKMWMNFAASNQTTRTWQSLKETFLKRVLPDITNPYYKLTVQQIENFRQGCDSEAMMNNKLQVRTVSDDSSNDATNEDSLTSNPNNNDNNDLGEAISSKINQNRSSVDTVVIEPCYETAEDIQNVLESHSDELEKENSPSPIPLSTKSIRDYITYSDPLTPMLREYASDDEGEEPQMQIVEYPEVQQGTEVVSPIERQEMENNDEVVHENEQVDTNHNDKSENTKGNNNKKEHDKINNDSKNNNDESNKETKNNNIEDTVIENEVTDDINRSVENEGCSNNPVDLNENIPEQDDIVPDVTVNDLSKDNNEKSALLTHSQNNSDSTVNTLPNNQEAFKELFKNNKRSINEQSPKTLATNENTNGSRKRSKSSEIELLNSKKRICTDKTNEQNTVDSVKPTKSMQNQKDSKLPSKGSQKQVTIKRPAKTIREKNKDSPQNLSNPVGISDRNKNNNKASDVNSSRKQTTEQDSPISTNEDIPIRIKPSKEHRKRRSADADEVINDVVVLNSCSETSEPGASSTKRKKGPQRAVLKMHRDRALANVFGFSSVIKSSRKRNMKNRKTSIEEQGSANSSSSSEWTSDSRNELHEYVSPPRARKNKQSRKYLKPTSARVLSLEEDGGLFVMAGKKIYPVVKDKKIVKNYLTFMRDNESEEEESYWKFKYVEQRKKNNELEKLLKDMKKTIETCPQPQPEPVALTVAPIINECLSTPTPSIPSMPTTPSNPQQSDPLKGIVEKKEEEPVVTEPEQKKEPLETKESQNVKIKFVQQDKEVQLEGHWSHINPVLEQVVKMMHKTVEPQLKQLPESRVVEPEPLQQEVIRQVSREENQGERRRSNVHDGFSREAVEGKRRQSRAPTPRSGLRLSEDSDEDVRKKLNEKEEQILKLIEERENIDNTATVSEEPSSTNVTKRRPGRPSKQSMTPTAQDSNSNVTQRIRTKNTPGTPAMPAAQQSDKSTRVTRKSWMAKAQNEDGTDKYMLPSPTGQEVVEKKTRTPNKTRTQASKRKYPIKNARIFSSPDNISINSLETSLGYQDSDVSIQSICLRKKRKPNYTVLNRGRGKSRRVPRRKTQPYEHEDMTSSDSNVSYVTAPLKSSSYPNSSANTEEYRSESYQLLVPQRKKTIQCLDKIDENSPSGNDLKSLNNSDEPAINTLAEKNSLSTNENNSLSPAFVKYAENSSHVSLPPSPVLSIVEKISLNRSEIDKTIDIDIPDDRAPEDAKQTTLNKYMLSDIDMSVPLMAQEYDLQQSNSEDAGCHFNLNTQEVAQVTESLLNKICAVNITEPTLSESIHSKLKNLLLESAKKIAKQMNMNNDKEVVDKMEICEPVTQRKTKAKKRCSTPRKRQSKQDPKVGNAKQHIEKEHTELCGNGNPCPPPVLVVTQDAPDIDNIPATNINNEIRKSERIRKKKDVIKVKILKPKKRGYSSDSVVQKEAKTSLHTDSGINDTESGVFLHGLEDSVDLIHNHSDTCLHANECIGDSVEIIDDNAMSVISLNSNTEPIKTVKSTSLTALNGNKLLDICCENAQDGVNLHTAIEMSQHTNENDSIFNSPIENVSLVNSLITEDLSEGSPRENRVSRWYLLSEDEASNTNNVEINTKTHNNNAGYGASLQEIFPITCAVPDLSTITEENTAKFIFDGNSKSEYDSRSLPGKNK